MTRIPDDSTMCAADFRVMSFTLGPFQATLFPLPGPPGGPARFTVDLYHGGTTFTHPRFICTAEELGTLIRLSLAAESLIRDYLANGRSFSEWCEANRVNPFKPELTP